MTDEPVTASDNPIASYIIASLDILAEVEKDTKIHQVDSIGLLEIQKLRTALTKTRELLMISTARARAVCSTQIHDVEKAIAAVKFQLAIQPNPYSWAVTNFDNSSLMGMDATTSTYIKQTLRDHFAQRQMSFDDWNN